MALTIQLATRFWLKTIIMAIVCVVLGLWGMWDYGVTIPRAETGSARAELLRVVRSGLDTTLGSDVRSEALLALNSAIDQDDLRDTSWSDSLQTMRSAVTGGDLGVQRAAETTVDDGLKEYGSVIAPSKFDRPMQWLFIICLPCGFYYFWKYWKMTNRAKAFRLNDDGSLTTPDGSWSANEITDIDMSRWIAKTGNARSTWTAKAILEDGTTVLLDDYIYQDMHLIIGRLAHQFYPDEWSPLARRVKSEQVDDDAKEEE